jgi:RNA polymerase sigma-70 factor, ECF subfamily
LSRSRLFGQGEILSDQQTADDRHLDEECVQLLNRYKKPLYRLILCMVRSPSDAEDLFQQTAITMWDKFREFEPGSDFFAWVSAIARNKVRDFVKSKARQRVYFTDEVIDKLAAEEDSPAADEGRLQALIDCRSKLSRSDQSLLTACYGSGKTVVEVARSNQCSPGSIYSNLWRIRRALYACIQRAIAREELA